MRAAVVRWARLSTAAAVVAVLAMVGCAAGDPSAVPGATSASAAAPSVSPSVSPSASASASVSTSAGSFGPDGGHWPQNTPTLDDSFDLTMDVAPRWDAIAAAIRSAQSAQPQGKVIIRVEPGTLPEGSGAGSTMRGVLQDVGSPDRPWRILIVPRDGYGTVRTGTKGIAFVGVSGVSIVGIDMSASEGVNARNGRQFAIARTKMQRALISANGGEGVRTTEFVEVVRGPEQRDGSNDSVEIKVANGFVASDVRVVGCYFAPSYKPIDSGGHTDTIQYDTAGSGRFENPVLEDTVVFQSSSQAIMVSAEMVGWTISHSLLVGGAVVVGERYPFRADQYKPDLANTLWGGSKQTRVRDSIIIGSIGRSHQFAEVVNTTVTSPFAGSVASGQFSVMQSLAGADVGQLNELAPYPSDEYLKRIWG